MIEAMEQQILNSINNRWTKNRELRREIDLEKISECLRTICSSRNTTLSTIHAIKINGVTPELINSLKLNINWIFEWITSEYIQNILERYSTPIKDKKKEQEYLNEIPVIKDFFVTFQLDLVETTLNKLLIFHGIKEVIL